MDLKTSMMCAAASVFALALMVSPFPAQISLSAAPAYAAEVCASDVKRDDLDDAQALTLYECIKDKMYSDLQKSGLEEAKAYRDWALVSTAPFVSATHGNRFVRHYVNDIGKDAYVKWEKIGGRTMPVGSITAKESFYVNKKGQVRNGPFFLMEKVAAGTLPDTNDWKYTLMFPNGTIVGVSGTDTSKKVKFCHGCHLSVLEDQDGMFFPNVDYRVKSN